MASKRTKAAERLRQETMKIPREKRLHVAARVAKGQPIAKLAEIYGISENTVRRWARAYGTQLDADPEVTETRGRRRTRLPIKATAFACPHCGGPISPPE